MHFFTQTCNAREKSIIDLVDTQTSTIDFYSYCEGVSESQIADGVKTLQLIQIKECGENFSGRASIKGLTIEEVCWWTTKEDISSSNISSIFISLKDRIKVVLGREYFVDNIPNFQDATNYEHDAFIWQEGEYIIMLSAIIYDDKGSVSLSKQSKSAILLSGADYGQYWTKIFDVYSAEMAAGDTNSKQERTPKSTNSEPTHTDTVTTEVNNIHIGLKFIKYIVIILIVILLLYFVCV